MPAGELAQIGLKYAKKVFSVEKVTEALKIALAGATGNSAVFVVGSLYLAGEVREQLIELIEN